MNNERTCPNPNKNTWNSANYFMVESVWWSQNLHNQIYSEKANFIGEPGFPQ